MAADGCFVIRFMDMGLVEEISSFVKKRQSFAPDDTRTREIMLCAQIGSQIGEINLEQPETFKPFVLFVNQAQGSMVQFRVEERIYKLERDEKAMLKRISKTNIRAMGVDAFLYDMMGGSMGELKAKNEVAKGGSQESGLQQVMSLEKIIDKKKVFVEKKVMCQSKQVAIDSVFGGQLANLGCETPFEFDIMPTIKIKGTAKVCSNAHTSMPKGAFTFEIFKTTEFSKPAEGSTEENVVLEKIEDPVIRASKKVDIEGERLVYRLGQ